MIIKWINNNLLQSVIWLAFSFSHFSLLIHKYFYVSKFQEQTSFSSTKLMSSNKPNWNYKMGLLYSRDSDSQLTHCLEDLCRMIQDIRRFIQQYIILDSAQAIALKTSIKNQIKQLKHVNQFENSTKEIKATNLTRIHLLNVIYWCSLSVSKWYLNLWVKGLYLNNLTIKVWQVSFTSFILREMKNAKDFNN